MPGKLCQGKGMFPPLKDKSVDRGDPGAVVIRHGTDNSLPTPLDDQSYFQGHLVDIHQAKWGSGWSINESWKDGTSVAVRPGFVEIPVLISKTPGATLTLSFQGRGIGLFVLSGPDCGMVEYRIDEGPWGSVTFLPNGVLSCTFLGLKCSPPIWRMMRTL